MDCTIVKNKTEKRRKDTTKMALYNPCVRENVSVENTQTCLKEFP